MITQSIDNIRKIELTDIVFSPDTGEHSRFLNIDTPEGRISILLSAPKLYESNLKIKDHEIKTII